MNLYTFKRLKIGDKVRVINPESGYERYLDKILTINLITNLYKTSLLWVNENECA